MNTTIGVGSKLGSYRVLANLRVGGMATLFLARREGAAGFAKLVAIKVVHPHLASDPSFNQMFIDEAMISARVQHPNVVHVEELGEIEGTYFLAMEYVLGVTLWQLVRNLAEQDRRLAPALAVHIAAHIADGLHAAHETRGDDGAVLGLVHRDVSPQNVLVSTGGHVKVIDFGVAKSAGRAQETTAGTLKGKLGYMPPEQAFGRPIDRRTDLYALGIVLWEMLVGRRLFRAESEFALLELVRQPRVAPPSTLAPGIPPALDAVVLQALCPEPDGRFATAAALRTALYEALPESLRVDAGQLAGLIGSTCAASLAQEKALIDQAGGGGVSPVVPAPRAVLELTVSDSQIRLEPDASVVALGPSASGRGVAAPPSATGSTMPVTRVTALHTTPSDEPSAAPGGAGPAAAASTGAMQFAPPPPVAARSGWFGSTRGRAVLAGLAVLGAVGGVVAGVVVVRGRSSPAGIVAVPLGDPSDPVGVVVAPPGRDPLAVGAASPDAGTVVAVPAAPAPVAAAPVESPTPPDGVAVTPAPVSAEGSAGSAPVRAPATAPRTGGSVLPAPSRPRHSAPRTPPGDAPIADSFD